MEGTFRESPQENEEKEVEKYYAVVKYKDFESDKFIDIIQYSIESNLLILNKEGECIVVNMDSVILFYIEKQK